MKKGITLPEDQSEEVHFDSLTRSQRHNIERRGRRALYDLPPDLIRRISRLAETYRLTNSMVAGALMIHGLHDIQEGALDLAKLRKPSDSPRYDFRIDLVDLLKKWGIEP